MTEFCPEHTQMKKTLDEIRADTAAIRKCLQGDLHNPEQGAMSRLGALEHWRAEEEYVQTTRAASMQRTRSVLMSKVFDWVIKLAVVSAAAKFGLDWLKTG